MFVETNSGIAVVIPAWRVLNALNLESIVAQREAEESRLDKQTTAPSDVTPEASSGRS
jgi:hypothetical protein